MSTEEPAKPNKVTIMEMRIRIFMPLDPRDPFLAKIGNSPILFEGPTATLVKKQAEEWRQREWDRFHTKEKKA